MENETENNMSEQPASEPLPKKNIGRRERWLFMAALFVLVIFVSATAGGIFGFIASRSGSHILEKLKIKKLESLVSPDQSQQKEIIKQNIVQEDSAVIDVVKKSSPAVVSIVISKDVPNISSFGSGSDFFNDPFGFLYPDNGGSGNGSGNGSGGSNEKQTIGGGTGFFITKEGMIVTNRHVADDPKASYTVVTSDNKEFPAKVLALDPVNDVAIMKVEGTDFPTLGLGDSSAVQIGQTVIAIGNSLGQFSNTVSRGIISGLKRNLTAGGGLGQTERLNNIIQTDAAINPGNSGGPLLNINGEVIGVNVAIAQGAQNIGFAIPSNQIEKIVSQVKTTGKISTPFIGVRYITVDKTLQKQYNLPFDYGDLVIRGDAITDLAVVPGSPADKAGIMENDIILEVNGEKIDDSANGKSLIEFISQYNVGDVLTLKIWHKGETKEVQLTLEERK